MNLPNNATQQKSPDAEHRGLLLLRVAGVLDQLNDCEHRSNHLDPNKCLQCLALCHQLLNEANHLTKSIRDGALFYRADL